MTHRWNPKGRLCHFTTAFARVWLSSACSQHTIQQLQWWWLINFSCSDTATYRRDTVIFTRDRQHRGKTPQGRDEKWSDRGDGTLVHTRWECSDLLKTQKRGWLEGATENRGIFTFSLFLSFGERTINLLVISQNLICDGGNLLGTGFPPLLSVVWVKRRQTVWVSAAPRWGNVKRFLSTQLLGAQVAEPRERLSFK